MLTDKNKIILIIGTVWPEPASSAAGVRTLDLIRHFKSRSYDVKFASASSANEYRDALEQSGVQTFPVDLNQESSLRKLVAIKPDIILFDRFIIEEQFSERLREVWASEEFQSQQWGHFPRTILDTQDLHSLRRLREKPQHHFKKIEAIKNELLGEKDFLREMASLLRCDLTLVVSQVEYDFLVNTLGISNQRIFWVPWSVSPVKSEFFNRDWSDRSQVMMLGNFRHAPNRDGLQWYFEEIWPLIRKQNPSLKTQVYGAYQPESVTRYHRPELGFYLLGHCKNIHDTLSQHRLLVAPLRYGAGIKGKILEAWASGTPVVTTSIGSEGYGEYPTLDQGDHAHADQAQDFAEAVLKYDHQSKSWSDLQAQSKAALSRYQLPTYDTQIIQSFLMKLDLWDSMSSEQIKIDQQSNWMGELLRLQQYRSTLYFSKWIELKESKQHGV